MCTGYVACAPVRVYVCSGSVACALVRVCMCIGSVGCARARARVLVRAHLVGKQNHRNGCVILQVHFCVNVSFPSLCALLEQNIKIRQT